MMMRWIVGCLLFTFFSLCSLSALAVSSFHSSATAHHKEHKASQPAKVIKSKANSKSKASRTRSTHSSHFAKVSKSHKKAPVLVDPSPDWVDDAENEATGSILSTSAYDKENIDASGWSRFADGMGHELVSMAHDTVNRMTYSSYRMGGTRFDLDRGVYVLDCSDYVNHLLDYSAPQAFYSLVRGSGTSRPTSQDYYNFFTHLAYRSVPHWHHVESGSLKPGDILVFRYQGRSGRPTGGGHVMVVMGEPDWRSPDVLAVRVADSARSGHSEDTRRSHRSGIGIGTLLLKINPKSDRLLAFSWTLDGPWKPSNIAIARPDNA